MAKRLLSIVLALAFSAETAHAHLLPKQNATINIVDRSAFCVVSVPASVLRGVDDDGNGRLSLAEIQRHTTDIQRQFERRFTIRGDGSTATGALSWVMPPVDDGVETDYVVVLYRANFSDDPRNPELVTDLFGTLAGEGQMTVKASHMIDGRKVSEVAVLAPGTSSHRFFRGGWATFTDFVRVGVEHILSGPDHLLFLLTLIVAAAGWRYWLSVVTSFTIAHSITLALSALGSVRVPAHFVEPGIAASIVMMALLTLSSRSEEGAHSTRSRIAVVFACGLLHGFGFSSAIGAMAVDTGSRLATLAGFNVGIEIGQFVFLGVVVTLMTLGHRFVTTAPRYSLSAVASLIAAVLGTTMFIDRILPMLSAL